MEEERTKTRASIHERQSIKERKSMSKEWFYIQRWKQRQSTIEQDKTKAKKDKKTLNKE